MLSTQLKNAARILLDPIVLQATTCILADLRFQPRIGPISRHSKIYFSLI